MRTSEAADFVQDDSLGFVFIDADHSYDSAIDDIKNWEPKVRSGGLVCGHDTHFPEVYRAVRDYYGSRVKMVPHDHCWAVMKE
jgi:predicted O-methyltransferase YrrM